MYFTAYHVLTVTLLYRCTTMPYAKQLRLQKIIYLLGRTSQRNSLRMLYSQKCKFQGWGDCSVDKIVTTQFKAWI